MFLAERYLSISDNENQKCILAETYMAAGKFWSVYELLKNATSIRGKFLFAKAAC